MAEQVPTSESKEFKKAVKLLGEKEALELANKPEQELLDLISINAVEIKKQQDLVLQNPEYQKAALVIKDFKGALKDSVKSCVVTSAVATRVLRDRQLGGFE